MGVETLAKSNEANKRKIIDIVPNDVLYFLKIVSFLISLTKKI